MHISAIDISLISNQLISKVNYQAVNCSKKWTNEFVFTTMRRVFVHFSEETKKTFQNYQTFSKKCFDSQFQKSKFW